jgi:S-adenosylmethionine synthetase
MKNQQLVSAEAVANGHPDKIADQISDTVLDTILAKDKNARVACETLVKSDLVIIAGEISAKYSLDKFNLDSAIRNTISEIGYKNTPGFNSKNCRIRQIINKQSPEINKAVKVTPDYNQGAGDQGISVGFACSDTKALMPAPTFYAQRLMQLHASLRQTSALPWLLPDAKCLVVFEYEDCTPVALQKIVLSTQHQQKTKQQQLEQTVIKQIILPTIPEKYINNNTKFIINPSQHFTMGGPNADCGMTGRKLMVDTYGSMVPHGGGAFSGKDPSKIDRSGALMVRFIAKNLVAAKLAARVMVQLCYAIGVAELIAVDVNAFGTSELTKLELLEIVNNNFDLRPASIIERLDLLRPIYTKTAACGHFGWHDPEFTWEQIINVQH